MTTKVDSITRMEIFNVFIKMMIKITQVLKMYVLRIFAVYIVSLENKDSVFIKMYRVSDKRRIQRNYLNF